MENNGMPPKFIVCDTNVIIKLLSKHNNFTAAPTDFKPHIANITYNGMFINIILNNLMGNDVYSDICLCADLIGPMHIKGGVREWYDNNNVIFTESIGMAILEDKAVKRIIVEK